VNVPHELILASAGTGKTYQLVSRYLTLLFTRGEPERVIALTFTRKAAGEFFQKIFHALAEGAADAPGAQNLSKRLGIPVTPADCHARLRLLLDRLPRLQLSTYDSFFAGIVQTCALELGLAAAPQTVDETQQQALRRRTQSALARLARTDPELLAEFWHAFKQATLGQETKTMTELVDQFVARHHARYVEAPDATRWGQPATLWPAGCRWWPPPAAASAPATLAARVRADLDLAAFTSSQLEQWEIFLTQLTDWLPPAPVPDKVRETVAKKIIPVIDELPAGLAKLTLRKATPIPPEAGAALAELAHLVTAQELGQPQQTTQGLYAVLALFERRYDELVRRLGWLTIEDMTRLLLPDDDGANGLRDPLVRMAIDYRLDARYDHWLLDEFQDTSHAQWRVIANLVEEVLQDPAGTRSFFAVGDAKQSIYLWRQSDPRIFDRLLRRYASSLKEQKLDMSYRSGPDVLGLVNAVFHGVAHAPELLGENLAARWQANWQEHRCADHLATASGHAALLTPPALGRVTDETNTLARRQIVLDLLTTIQPLARGLSAAILTRSNAEAEALVDFLRAQGGPACSLAANVAPGRDNVAAAGLVSFLTVAAHPGDRLAWQHLRMLPPGRLLVAAHPTPAALSSHLLGRLATGGLTGLVRDWIVLSEPLLDPTDEFSRLRLQQCLEATLALETRGESDLDVLLDHLAGYTLREHDVPGQVAVMTIHKAKGLDWDVVILPDLEGNDIRRNPTDLLVSRNAEGDIDWLLQAPPQAIALAEPTLAAHYEEQREDEAFESLCALYVGLTRAKRALYVVTHPVAEKSASLNLPRILQHTLAGAAPTALRLADSSVECTWQSGNFDWFEGIALSPSAPPVAPADPLLSAAERRPDLPPRAHRPSAALTGDLPAAALLAGNEERADFGTAVHAALEQITWLDPTADVTGQVTRTLAPHPVEVRDLVLTALAQPDVRELFLPPAGPHRLACELPFEVLMDGQWISGKIDRLVLHLGDGGRVTSADLIDYKTDRLADAATLPTATARHHPQLEIYRAGVARLYGLPPASVRPRLVFLASQPPTVVVLPAATGNTGPSA